MIVGIGTDIVRVERIQRLLGRYPGFVHRVFTPQERAYCEARASRAQSYAARFAAKEAVMKALGTGWNGRVNWLDIEVVNDTLGKPCLNVHGHVAELLAGRGVSGLHISITHEKEYALACAVLESGT